MGQGACYILAGCSSMINQELKHLLQSISQCAMALRFLRTLLRQRPSYQVIHMSLAICARQLLHKYINSKKLYLGLLLLIQKRVPKCLLFIITSVPESLQQDAKFLELSYSFAQQITLSFEMQVSQSSSISKAVKMKSIVRGNISICCEEVEHNFTICGPNAGKELDV